MKQQRWQKSEKRKEEKKSEKRKRQKKEDAGARKGGTVANHCVFQMIWGSGGSKSRLAKAADQEPSGEIVSKSKCANPLMRGALVEVEMFNKRSTLGSKNGKKAPHGRSTLGS